MAEPSLATVSAGAGLVVVATVALGPILGEYSIIIGFGLLGTLIALSESVQTSIWKSLLFVIRGVIFSFVFSGLITSLVVKYLLPQDLGNTPYIAMGAVAFVIGWSSDRFQVIKNALLKRVSKIVDKNDTP